MGLRPYLYRIVERVITPYRDVIRVVVEVAVGMAVGVIVVAGATIQKRGGRRTATINQQTSSYRSV